MLSVSTARSEVDAPAAGHGASAIRSWIESSLDRLEVHPSFGAKKLPPRRAAVRSLQLRGTTTEMGTPLPRFNGLSCRPPAGEASPPARASTADQTDSVPARP